MGVVDPVTAPARLALLATLPAKGEDEKHPYTEEQNMNHRLTRRGIEKPLQAVPGQGLFVGYASLFNERDHTGDIVLPGAFAASLNKKSPDNIRMLFQHDPAEPVGTWLEIRETEKGLYVQGRLDLKVQRGRELFSLLETGGIDGLSIGFKTVRATRDRVNNARLLSTIDLWEISLVTFPMLEGARVNTAKSAARARPGFLQTPRPHLITKGLNPTWI